MGKMKLLVVEPVEIKGKARAKQVYGTKWKQVASGYGVQECDARMLNFDIESITKSSF